jgi:hypothetical protein
VTRSNPPLLEVKITTVFSARFRSASAFIIVPTLSSTLSTSAA